MKIINAGKSINDLNGIPLLLGTNEKDLMTIGDVVSACLVSQKQAKDPVRALKIAFKIKDGKGKIELEDADFEIAEQAIKENTNLTTLVAGQVLEEFENTKLVKEK